MKNRVLRLALVVVLVMALVLTLVACGEKATVTPTPTSTPSTTPTPTPTATVTDPVVTNDEAKLNQYGIWFPSVTDVTYNGKPQVFDIVRDNTNLYQLAYDFTFKTSYEAVNFEGTSIRTNIGRPSSSGTRYTFQDAGIYTVTYQVTVEQGEDEYGLYTTTEVDETYTVTKTYTINKKQVAVTSKDDAFQVEEDKAFPSPVLTGLEGVLDPALGTDGYVVSADVINADLTTVGEYKLTISIRDSRQNIVSLSDIVDPNNEFTLVEGTRYVLNATDVAKANAVRKQVRIDSESQLKTTEYSLETINAYKALTAGQKVLSQADYNKSELYMDYLAQFSATDPVQMDIDEYNMGRTDMFKTIETLGQKYAAAQSASLKKQTQKELFDAIYALSTKQPVDGKNYGSDLSFVISKLAENDVKANTVDGTGKITEYFDHVWYLTLTTANGENQVQAIAEIATTPGTVIASDATVARPINGNTLSTKLVTTEVDYGQINKASNELMVTFVSEFITLVGDAPFPLTAKTDSVYGDVGNFKETPAPTSFEALQKQFEVVTKAYDALLSYQQASDIQLYLTAEYAPMLFAGVPAFDDTDADANLAAQVAETEKFSALFDKKTVDTFNKDMSFYYNDTVARYNSFLTTIENFDFSRYIIEKDVDATLTEMKELIGYDFAQQSLTADPKLDVDSLARVVFGRVYIPAAPAVGNPGDPDYEPAVVEADREFEVPSLHLEEVDAAYKTIVEYTLTVQEAVDNARQSFVEWTITTLGANAYNYTTRTDAYTFVSVNVADPEGVTGADEILAAKKAAESKDRIAVLYAKMDAGVASDLKTNKFAWANVISGRNTLEEVITKQVEPKLTGIQKDLETSWKAETNITIVAANATAGQVGALTVTNGVAGKTGNETLFGNPISSDLSDTTGKQLFSVEYVVTKVNAIDSTKAASATVDSSGKVTYINADSATITILVTPHINPGVPASLKNYVVNAA